MKSKIKSIITLLLVFVAQVIFAQGNEVEMADEMRSNGKIYVVVGVIITIFIGFLIYLIVTERKIAELEKETGIK